MKEGDIFTEKELEEKGWKYKYHITHNTYSYIKDDIVIFWNRNTHEIEATFDYHKFIPP